MTAEKVRQMFDEAPIYEPDWPAPDMSVLRDQRQPAPSLPLECFGAWRQWIEAAAEAKGAPVDYVAAGLLAAGAGLIGNARWGSPWAGWCEPSCLWLAVVGLPSSGKSPALDAARDLLRRIEADREPVHKDALVAWQRDAAAAKAVREEWTAKVREAAKAGKSTPDLPAGAQDPDRPGEPRVCIADATIEKIAPLLKANPKGLIQYRDELAMWLQSFSRYSAGSDRPFWLEAYGGRAFAIDRVRLGTESLRISHLTVSVIGGIQPDRLRGDVLGAADDGLAARFLWFWPDPLPPMRPTRLPDDDRALAALRRLAALDLVEAFRSSADIGVGEHAPRFVHFTAPAAALFDEWRKANAEAEKECRGLTLSHRGKLPGLAVRLATVLALLDWSLGEGPEPATLDVRPVGLALHLIDAYLVPMASRVFGDAGHGAGEQDAAALARHIHHARPGRLNQRDFRRSADSGKIGLRDDRDLGNAAAALVEAGWLRPVAQGTGRPRKEFLVNPRIWEGCP